MLRNLLFLPLVTCTMPAGADGAPLGQQPGGKPVVEAVVAQTIAGIAAARAANQSFYDANSKCLVRTGMAISYPNEDNIRRHVYAFSPLETVAKSDASGKVVVANLPAGEYGVRAWRFRQADQNNKHVRQLRLDPKHRDAT